MDASQRDVVISYFCVNSDKDIVNVIFISELIIITFIHILFLQLSESNWLEF